MSFLAPDNIWWAVAAAAGASLNLDLSPRMITLSSRSSHSSRPPRADTWRASRRFFPLRADQ